MGEERSDARSAGRSGRGVIDALVRGLVEAERHALDAEQLADAAGLLQRFDPRIKLVALFALIVGAVATRSLTTLAVLFVVAVALAALSGISPVRLGRQVWAGVLLFSGLVVLPALVLVPGESVAQLPLVGWTITLQGLPTIAGQAAAQPPALNPNAPQLIVAPAPDAPAVPASVYRLSAVHLPEYARPTLSEVQRERLQLLEMFEASHNLSVADYAKLVGKSRRWITYEIQAGNLLSIHLGHRGQRVPDWQLDPIKRKLIQAVLKLVPRGIDTWHIYHALLRPYDALGKCPVIEAVDPTNLHLAARLVAAHAIETDELAEQSEASPVLARQTVERLVKTAMLVDTPEDLVAR